VEGLFRRPTIVNNVETFANLRAILTLGGKAYATIGTAQSTGPKLVSLDSYFAKPGIYEVAMGTPLLDVIDLAGGFKTKIKAIQIRRPARRYRADVARGSASPSTSRASRRKASSLAMRASSASRRRCR